MSRERVLTDEQWARIEPLMPSPDGQKSRPFRDHRQVVEGIIYRLRTGIAWRDLPASFGWETAQDGHARGDERHLIFAAHRLPLALSAPRQLSAPLDRLQHLSQVPT